MKNRMYKVVFDGKVSTVAAYCEEGAYWAVLAKNGVYPVGDIESIIEKHNMEIFLA